MPQTQTSALWWTAGALAAVLIACLGTAAAIAYAMRTSRTDAGDDVQAVAPGHATVAATTSSSAFVPIQPSASFTSAPSAVGLARDTAPVASAEPPATTSASASPQPNRKNSLSLAELERVEGNYKCAMDDTPAFACRIADGTLEKLGGSQRFKGPITALPSGDLAFRGTFFCPWGSCTHPVAATFVKQAPGLYVGHFGPNEDPSNGGGPGGERVVLNKVK